MSPKPTAPILAPTRARHSMEHNDELLVTGEAVALEVRPASFILRAAGAAIDIVLSVGLLLLAIYLIGIWQAATGADDALSQALTITSLVFCVVVVPVATETLSHGRSLGRWAVGARIVRDDGGAASFRHALIRALTGVLEIYLTLGGLAAIVSLLNSRSKRFGDLLAGTYAQHERVPRYISGAQPMPPELYGWARVADVAKLPDRLSRRIAQYLRQAPGIVPDARARVSAQLLRDAAPYVSPLPAEHPDTVLLGIAALRRDREARALELERARLARLAPALTGLPNGFPER